MKKRAARKAVPARKKRISRLDGRIDKLIKEEEDYNEATNKERRKIDKRLKALDGDAMFSNAALDNRLAGACEMIKTAQAKMDATFSEQTKFIDAWSKTYNRRIAELEEKLNIHPGSIPVRISSLEAWREVFCRAYSSEHSEGCKKGGRSAIGFYLFWILISFAAVAFLLWLFRA